MVRIGVIGVGPVGVVHAAATARFGHTVVGYDIDKERVEAFSSGARSKIDPIIHEQGLPGLISDQLKAGRLSFTTDPSLLIDSEVLFMCLPTPYEYNGKTNTSFFYRAAETLVDVLLSREDQRFVLFANKSTVPIGTAQKLEEFLTEKGLENFDVASNPEFLPEGEAVKYARSPQKVVIGAKREKSLALLRRVYSSFVDNESIPYLEFSNPETAEANKYTSNASLYTQAVHWQAVAGQICEVFPMVNYEDLRRGVLADRRFSPWGSYLSAGVGGSCLKKDERSLARQLEEKGADADFLWMIDNINERNKTRILERAELEANYSFNNKIVAMLGLSFKQGSNDMREANVLKMVPWLFMQGASEIKAYDPLAIEEAKRQFNPDKNRNFARVNYFEDVIEAIKKADCAVIATDHQEFRGFPDIIRKYVKPPFLLIDGRRIIPRQEVPLLLEDPGISYIAVGGAFMPSRST